MIKCGGCKELEIRLIKFGVSLANIAVSLKTLETEGSPDAETQKLITEVLRKRDEELQKLEKLQNEKSGWFRKIARWEND